jgi:hypothetical protein
LQLLQTGPRALQKLEKAPDPGFHEVRMRSKYSTHRLAATLAGVLVACAPAAHLLAQGNVGTVYVHAAGPTGAPIVDLGPPDFHVTMDGTTRKISAVRYIGDPRRVLMLVDNTTSSIIVPLRAALHDLLAGIPAEDEVGLITIAGQLHIRVEPTLEHERVKEAIDVLNTEPGTAVMMDALVQGTERFLGKEDRAPVVVLVGAEGEDASSTRDDAFNKFVARFAARGGIVHAVMLSAAAVGREIRPTAGGNTPRGAIITPDVDNPSIIAMNITQNTGGRYEIVNSPTALSDKLKGIADEIKADGRLTIGWYKVDFSLDKNQKTLRVEVMRPDTKVQLSQGRPRLAPAAAK